MSEHSADQEYQPRHAVPGSRVDQQVKQVKKTTKMAPWILLLVALLAAAAVGNKLMQSPRAQNVAVTRASQEPPESLLEMVKDVAGAESTRATQTKSVKAKAESDGTSEMEAKLDRGGKKDAESKMKNRQPKDRMNRDAR